MFENFVKIAWRNLWRNKGFSAINIFGLAIGLATCLLLLLYISNELSYDRFHEKADRIYRINADLKLGGGELRLAVASDPMGPILKKDYPEVEEYTRVYSSEGPKRIRKGNQFVVEQNVVFADSSFFDVFTFPAIAGDTHHALTEPNTVVMSSTAARKYFQTDYAVGRTLLVGTKPFKVTAVIKDMPNNSHFHFDFILSMFNANYNWNNYLSNNFQTYLVLRKGTDYKLFEKNFEQVVEKYLVPQAQQFMHIISMEEFRKAGNKEDYSLIPLTDIHLHSDRTAELEANGNIQYVYIFGAVAIFVLLIACVNFMNLSTAHSARRAREVGIRKVLGTEKGTLIRQFLVESVLTVFIAMVFGLAIACAVLPLFNLLTTQSFSVKDFFTVRVVIMLVVMPFVAGILAGAYPAFFLSRFKPVAVLKGNLSQGFRRNNFRSVLVVFQFVTSIILIICTIVIFSQLHYIQNARLGFDKSQVIVINNTSALGRQAQAFKNAVTGFSGVSSGSVSGFLPVSSSSRNDNSFSKTPVLDARFGLNMQRWTVDYDYLTTMGMQIAKGRNFSQSFGGDSSAILINETAAKLLDFDDPVGKDLYTYDDRNHPTAYHVIGVIKNFNFESLRQSVGPLCMMLGDDNSMLSVRVNAVDIRGLVGRIEQIWKEMAPETPFSYRFLDDSFNQMYRSEQVLSKVAIIFAVLAILIACMGLLGLVTFAAEQRTREIGVRKVLGATVSDIVGMLSRDFMKLIVIASFIAFPIAWWAMSKWLEDFVYRIHLNAWVFVAAGAMAVLIAVLTISYQALKAAFTNPAKSLRAE